MSRRPFIPSRPLLLMFLAPGVVLFPLTYANLLHGEYAVFAWAVFGCGLEEPRRQVRRLGLGRRRRGLVQHDDGLHPVQPEQAHGLRAATPRFEVAAAGDAGNGLAGARGVGSGALTLPKW